MIAFGCALQLTGHKVIGIICFIASSICCLSVYVLLYQSREELQAAFYQFQLQSKHAPPSGESQRKLLLASRKVTLITCIAALFPLFPVAYILRWYDYFDDNLLFAAFMLLSAGTKVVYASLCMDAHLEVSHPAIGLIDAEKFSNTSRRAFIRYVFHEVRVPLNSIALGIQILANHGQDSDGKSCVASVYDKTQMDTLSMIRDAVNFMGDTLNDVMALQKVEEGSLELILKPFSIYDLFQNIEDTFLEVSSTADVALETVVDNSMPQRLIGDKFRIRHVLCNLVSNAIKYSNPGSVVKLIVQSDGNVDSPHNVLPKTVTLPSSNRKDQSNTVKGNRGNREDGGIELIGGEGCTKIIRSSNHYSQRHQALRKKSPRSKSVSHNNKYDRRINSSNSNDADDYEKVVAKFIKFQVIDEGQGIPNEVANEIFSPFHRLKDGELTEGRGSGLGLAICREIVHMHGGHISFVSVVGEGTTFTVILPLEIAELRPPTDKASPTSLRSISADHNPIPDINASPRKEVIEEDPSSSCTSSLIISPSQSASELRKRSHKIMQQRNQNVDEIPQHPSIVRYPSKSSIMTINSIDDEDPGVVSFLSSSSSGNLLMPAKGLKSLSRKQFENFDSRKNGSEGSASTGQKELSKRSPKMSSNMPFNHHQVILTNPGNISGDFSNHTDESMASPSKPSNMVEGNEIHFAANSSRYGDDEASIGQKEWKSLSRFRQVYSALTTISVDSTSSKEGETVQEGNKSQGDTAGGELSDNNFQGLSSLNQIVETTQDCASIMVIAEDASKSSTLDLSTINSNCQQAMTDISTVIKSMKIDIPSIPIGQNIDKMAVDSVPVSTGSGPSSQPTTARRFEELANMKVLIVDGKVFMLEFVTYWVSSPLFFFFIDVMSNRKLLALLLQQKGIKPIDFAEDGVKAIDCIQTKGFSYYDLVFMDNTMPNMVSRIF